jgi:hypothetical protein
MADGVKEIYVVVLANDQPHPKFGQDPGGEIVLETYTATATLENARKGLRRFSHCGGRIARLEFLPEETIE